MGTMFKIKVNGSEAIEFESRFSQYNLAVMDAFGALEMPYPCTVEIWVEQLLPEYGPYIYKIDDFVDCRGDRYGCPSVMIGRHKNSK